MITRLMSRPLLRAASRRTSTNASFSTTQSFKDGASASPAVKKPVGAFRGGLFGFMSGALSAGALIYYYILAEYRVSNEMLTEDIYALQAATQKLQTYISELEGRVDRLHGKK